MTELLKWDAMYKDGFECRVCPEGYLIVFSQGGFSVSHNEIHIGQGRTLGRAIAVAQKHHDESQRPEPALMQWTSTQDEKLFSAGAVYISDKKYTIFMPFDIGPDTPACSVLDPNDILIASPKTLNDAKQAAQYHYEAVRRAYKRPPDIPLLSVNPLQLPDPGSVWKHYNGNMYRVLMVFNKNSDRQEKYPATIGYMNIVNGEFYSRKATDWHRSMSFMFREAMDSTFYDWIRDFVISMIGHSDESLMSLSEDLYRKACEPNTKRDWKIQLHRYWNRELHPRWKDVDGEVYESAAAAQERLSILEDIFRDNAYRVVPA